MTARLSLAGPRLPLRVDRKEAMLQRSMRLSWVVIFVCFGGIGGWLATARLDSAAVAEAILENEGSTRTIQHLEGGIVREILVRNGDIVVEGQPLMRLDPTASAATATLFASQLYSSRARQARLEAEVGMAEALAFPAQLTAAAENLPEVARVLANEARQFDLRRQDLEQSRDILLTNIGQAQAQIDAMGVSRDIAGRELAIVTADLADQRTLMARGLTAQAQVTALERNALEQEEKIAQADIEKARIAQSVAGLRLQITQAEQSYRREAAAELEAVTREIRELERNAVVANDSLQRIDITAPVAGTVQESILGTVGAVIRGGEVLMKIAPQSDDRIIVARISPDDIENVMPGVTAHLAFPAFASLLLEPATGEVLTVSRDRVVDPISQASYFEARIRLDTATLPADLQDRLVAGMRVGATIPTGERTALEYVLGPILRRFDSAMRED